MQNRPAYEIAAGSFVAAMLDGRRTLCLKAERLGKEHTNHFLVPLDPVDDRARLALLYIDPNQELVQVDGVHLDFQDGPSETAPVVGDAFINDSGTMLKLLDDPHSQRLHCYVDLTTGMVRARMERQIRRLLSWSVGRV
ncbi:MAG TPA: hypothetical protein VLL76_10265 [Candidatus Omnitrophota bacterium]|nr:hypothetical protein [Candidatus Omnitrophota bacterium]